MNQLGNGLHDAGHYEDALSVREAEMAWMRRLGASADNILAVQSNLASTYAELGRLEDALRLKRVVYRGVLQRYGEESIEANAEAVNLALALRKTGNKQEATELVRARIPVAE